MTTKENIKAILSCNFSGFKDEHIETATNRIMETVNTTCPNCDSGYAQGYSDGYLNGKAERPHGKWIDEGQYAEGHTEHAYLCKNCGYQIIENPNMIFENRFCKWCGAQMEVKKNDR